jgi:microcystin synthetase protein McyA
MLPCCSGELGISMNECDEMAAALKEHPEVKDADVRDQEDASGSRCRIAYVIPRTDPAEVARRGQWMKWRSIFDSIVRHAPKNTVDATADPTVDPTFQTAGWNSSYTGQPLSADEMRQWLEDRINLAQQLRPRRILELGCGTGLLLFRLAPGCSEYVGTDISSLSLDHIRRHLPTTDIPADRVRLHERPAHDFSDLPTGHFDLVILNSVVQYFPDVDYLLRVLRGAAATVAPGGSILLGDIRSLPLREPFHTSVQIVRAAPDETIPEVQKRIHSRLAGENELLLDPAFFAALPRTIERFGHVDVRLTRGLASNELTRYRYNVLLHLDRTSTDRPGQSLDWEAGNWTMTAVRDLLARRPARLEFVRIPNARVQPDVRLTRLFNEPGRHPTIGELRAAPASGTSGVDPEEFHTLGELGYKAWLCWSADSREGRFDAVLTPSSDAPAPGPRFALTRETVDRPWTSYATQPIRRSGDEALSAILRAHLQQRKPAMVPSTFVFLDQLPSRD